MKCLLLKNNKPLERDQQRSDEKGAATCILKKEILDYFLM